nr:zinc finger protein 513-like [Cherax quadricarinatus]
MLRESDDVGSPGDRVAGPINANCNNTKLLRCPNCPYSTNQDAHFLEHWLTHGWENTFSCPFCPYKASDYNQLKRHFRMHTGEKSFSCPHCPYVTIDSSNLKRHIRTHTGEKPYSCPHCPYQSSLKGNLNRHLRSHLKIIQLKERTINKRADLSTFLTVERHPVFYDFSGVTVLSNVGLDSEAEQHSGGGAVGRGRSVTTSRKLHQCPVCPYTTTNRSHWIVHYRTHTGEKPYACPYCSYEAVANSDLKRHIRIHTGEKPFSCPHCSYQTAVSTSLKRHILTHTR